ncbi:DNA-directed RNA polymerase subunit alpha [Candidatus Parcubacteria bacterium]|nr:MAG: DNA-directed RNA polymerase subunit alpha [Candidatus Parcubacteria bacterium]
MEYAHLSSTVRIRTVAEDARKGVFEISGLFAGYGLTLGNAIRRVLLSSLPGAAITQFKVKGVMHEFSTIPGMLEDVIEFSLNLKQVRFRMHENEPKTLTLRAKGKGEVTAGQIEGDATVAVANPDFVIAHLTSDDAEIEVDLTVERGIGYSQADMRGKEKLPIGAIAVDANFSPIVNVSYTVENMRVGDRTDYNQLTLEIETDGTISPSAALHKASKILKDHFDIIGGIEIQEFELPQLKKAKSSSAKQKKKTAEQS